jgi:hypothetical protein
MGEIITEAIRLYTLPLTTALVIVCIYWLMVAIGFLDTDSLDIDTDIDIDADIDANLDVETHVHTSDLDIDLNHDVDHDVDTHGHADGNTFGDISMAFLRFVNVSEVPLMMVLSLLILFMWGISMISNYYLNPGHSWLIAAGLFVGNFFLSSIMTKIVTTPLKPIMRAFKKNAKIEEEPVVGSIGSVRSGEVTTKHGQIEVMRNSTPLYLNAHISEGRARLKKGDSIIVVDFDKEKDSYLIKPNDIKQLED